MQGDDAVLVTRAFCDASFIRFVKRFVIEIYEKHHPEKLGSVDSLMKKYGGSENLLLRNLASKYKCNLPASS
jgi:hypothetical protein